MISNKYNLIFPMNLLKIRELEFLDSDYEFNEESTQQSSYLGPHGRSVILVHKGVVRDKRVNTEEEYFNDTVCLVMAISVNGVVQELEDVRTPFGLADYYRMKLDPTKPEYHVSPSASVEIIQAFRLQLLPKDSDWKKYLISDAEFRSMHSELHATNFTNISFASEKDLDFIIRRNLEHILSVCSIPVQARPEKYISVDVRAEVVTSSTIESRSQLPKADANDEALVALSCGDISGHRLVTSASL